MILKVLGRARLGKKSFSLISVDQFGYNIECKDGGGIVKFNNVGTIKWLSSGHVVYIIPEIIKNRSNYDFTRYDKIIITKAKKVEDESFVSLLGPH
ncbi:hypothetical protein [Pedobacter sp. NJ-S-72]